MEFKKVGLKKGIYSLLVNTKLIKYLTYTSYGYKRRFYGINWFNNFLDIYVSPILGPLVAP